MQVSAPYMDEREIEAVTRALRSGQWAQGTEVAALEQEFSAWFQGHSAVAVSSGTAALWAALHSLGLGPGQEVAVPAFSFVASANCALYCGARPVFVDADVNTGNLCVTHLELLLTARPRLAAVVVVHLYGHPAPMGPIMELAQHFQLAVVEDCAQALGATWEGRLVGSWGQVGCFSFYPTKHVACGEGGMVLSRDNTLVPRLRRFINHGQAGRYHHVSLGYNLRMSDIHAALARVQLERLPDALWQRQKIAGYYQQHISHPRVSKPRGAAGHAWQLYTLRCPERDALQRHLAACAVPTAIHYPTTLPQQPCFAGEKSPPGNFPGAESLAAQVLSLPLHPGLSAGEMGEVVQGVTSFW